MRPDGSIDAERYPGFGRLAREATWYSHATTVHDNTTQAVPAILTGDIPRRNALPTLADEPRNLFTLLGETYAFRVREAISRLCPVRYCPDHESSEPLVTRVSDLLHDVGINYLYGALPAGLRGDVTPLREGWGALVDTTGLDGDALVRSMNRSNPPRTLYLAHILQPHVPWERLPSGHRYGDASVIEGITDDWEPGKYEQWRDHDPWLVAEGLQRHLLQVGYVDRFVRRLLDRLDETGLYDRALIVLTADHGVSFRPGGFRRRTTAENVGDIAAVPLFVKYPGQLRGHEDRRAASTIDILPTIADVLRIRLPWRVDGRSLRARTPIERSVRIGRPGAPAVVARPEAVAAAVLGTARRNAAWFGTGADSLYRFGPRRELIGRNVTSFPRSAAPDADVLIPRAAELAHVRTASGYLPVHILGRIAWSSLRPREDLAVAVNGQIAAVTRPFVSTGDTWLAVMVDESLLHDGSNSVDVFAVRGTGRNSHLLRLGGTGTRSVAAVGTG
jgi:Sulfatase